MSDTFSLKDLESKGPVLPNLIPKEESLNPDTFSLKDLGLPSVKPSVDNSTFNLRELGLGNKEDGFNLEGPSSFINVEKIQKEKYDSKDLNRDQILGDDDLMEVVYQSLESRFKERSKKSNIATGTLGGATGGNVFSKRDYRKMPRIKAYEIWENYQRSFDAANMTTVGNEYVFGMNADEETKAKLGAAYKLFNLRENLVEGVVKRGAVGEMFDGIWDYTRFTVADPSTPIAYGLGRVFSFLGGKATGQAFSKTMTAAYENALKKGLTKKAAATAISEAMVKAAPAALTDAGISFGVDIGRQLQLMEVNNKKFYSKAEGALTAAGSMMFPIFAGGSTLFKEVRKHSGMNKTFLGYQEIDKMIKKHSPAEAMKRLKDMLDSKGLFKAVDAQFGTVKGKPKNFLPWEALKKDATDRLTAVPGAKRVDAGANNAFFRYLFLGDPDGKVKGYFQALEDANFVMHPQLLKQAGNVTSAWAQTISFINPAKLNKMITDWEEQTGYVLDGVRTAKGKISPKMVQAQMARGTSLGGEALWLSSELSRMQKAGVSMKKAMEVYKRLPDTKDSPMRNQAALSLYKRLITAHLSTTGANVRGFQALVSLNTAADFVVGSLDLVTAGMSKAVGATTGSPKFNASATKYYNRAYGRYGGALRRLTDTISPDIPVEYADAILEMNPKIMEKLFRDVAGDGGVQDTLAMFNLDGESYKKMLKDAGLIKRVAGTAEKYLWKSADAYTKGIQVLTFARLQDNLTKRFAFGTNLNQQIMMKYGVPPEKFFSNPDVEFTMAKPEFRELMEKAAYRTMRETASVNWSTLPANNFMRKTARYVEQITNRSALGYVVPFGSFLNTTIATAGDLTGVNAARYYIKSLPKAFGGNPSIDPVTDEGAELLSKAIVGWSAIGLGVGTQVPMIDEKEVIGMPALDRVRNGYTFKQEPMPDGTVRNKEFEWPISLIRASSQAIAHGMIETDEYNMAKVAKRLNTDENFREQFLSAIPEDLWTDLTVQVGPGQALRDLDDLGTSIIQTWRKAKSGDVSVFSTILNVSAGAAAKVGSGFTRHFDPVTTAYGIFNDMNMNPDLRQGNKFMNDVGRYLTQLTGASEDLPRKTTPTRGILPKSDIDLSKQFFGMRMDKEPTLVERMFNSAGSNIFLINDFKGTAKVRSFTNALLAPELQLQADLAMDKYPNFFGMKQDQKEQILGEIRKKAKAGVERVLDRGGVVPETMNLVRQLTSQKSKTLDALSRVDYAFDKRFFGFMNISFDEKMDRIMEMEDGYAQLKVLKRMVDTHDEWENSLPY